MGEIEQLKKRIIDSGYKGVKTEHIRDDYEPIGQQMIRDLCATGKFWQQRQPDSFGMYSGPWKIWAIEFKPN